MNERILELAEQAGFENGHQDRDGRSLSDELEKFAKLIVQEHMSLLTDCYRGTKNAQEWDNALLFLEKHIKEHFGVEE